MKRFLQAVLFLVLIGTSAVAQDQPAQVIPRTDRPIEERPLSFYKLEFVLREVQDGKTINSRNYMLTVENNDRAETKTGARVPVRSGMNGFQYMDLGVNINCRVVGRNDYASIKMSVEISSVAAAEANDSQPVVRSMRTEMAAVVPLGKPTLIGFMDDVNSTKRYEIAVTATKLK